MRYNYLLFAAFSEKGKGRLRFKPCLSRYADLLEHGKFIKTTADHVFHVWVKNVCAFEESKYPDRLSPTLKISTTVG